MNDACAFWYQHLDGLAHELFARVSEEPFRLTVHQCDSATRIDSDDGICRGFEETPQHRVRALALAHVMRDGRDTDDHALRVQDRRERLRDGDAAPVSTHMDRFPTVEPVTPNDRSHDLALGVDGFGGYQRVDVTADHLC